MLRSFFVFVLGPGPVRGSSRPVRNPSTSSFPRTRNLCRGRGHQVTAHHACAESLDEELLNAKLDVFDLLSQLRALVGGDGASDDRPGHAASAAKGDLGRHEDVRGVLVLAQEWEVEEDGQRLSVGSKDDELRDAAVQGLGCLVGTLLELLVVGSLLHETEDHFGEIRVRERVRAFVNLGHVCRGRWVDGENLLSLSVGIIDCRK